MKIVIGVELTRRGILAISTTSTKTWVTLQQILNIVSIELEENQFDILSTSRKRELVDARRIYAMIAKETTTHTLDEIAYEINRDHAGILHYVRTGDELTKCNKEFNDKYTRVRKILRLSIPKDEDNNRN